MKDNLKIPKARIEEEDKLRTQIIDSQIVGTADEEQHILMIFFIYKISPPTEMQYKCKFKYKYLIS